MDATSRVDHASRLRSRKPIRAAGLAVRPALMRPVFLGSAFLGVMLTAMAAPAGLPGDQGAWVPAGRDCTEVYAAAGRGLSFRKPVDLFAPAFIVSGPRIRTPMASCRIRSIRTVQGRDHLELDCANAVASTDVRVVMAPGKAGTSTRYYSSEDPTGIAYRRCPERASAR